MPGPVVRVLRAGKVWGGEDKRGRDGEGSYYWHYITSTVCTNAHSSTGIFLVTFAVDNDSDDGNNNGCIFFR